MKKIINIIIEQIFPSLSVRKANKKLKEKINSKDNQSNVAFMDNVDVISIESFRKKYAETFDVKNKFEDKAKTNVIGITIAITVIMGASGLIDSLIKKYTFITFHWISFFLLLAAIIYLLVSGMDAIKVLFDENTMSTIDLPELSADDIETKRKYDDCANRNINRNIVRNNIVYSSYICIRNALICMMVLFILLSIPFNGTKSKGDNKLITSNSSISYSSSIIIPENIDTVNVNNSIMKDKEKRKSIEDGAVYNFVNIDEKYVVQYKCFENEIIVEDLFCFDLIE
jgi:hypothetical protein